MIPQTSSYELRLAQFSGPLDKLLELIEADKLDVSRFSLAAVTDGFLKYLETLENVPPVVLADFIVVGSQLILLKSKSLIPDLSLTAEEERSLEELEERLRAYREFKEAGKLVLGLWKKGVSEVSRPYFLSISRSLPQATKKAPFYPGQTLTMAQLLTSLGHLAASIQKIVLEEETIRDTVITLEEKMKHVLDRLREIENTHFSDLTASTSRAETIVAFLAILHLAREQAIQIEQAEHLSDIMITWNGKDHDN